MDEKIINIIKDDIDRCKAQSSHKDSDLLYQTLIVKYDYLFPGFSENILVLGKMTDDLESDNRPELNAIKEKLELMLIVEQNKDSLFKFKEMMNNDIEQLKKAVSENALSENEKKDLYMSVTAKYHSYVPQLGEGLYQYFAEQGFYDEVTGESLEYNLRKIYNKLVTFRSLNYPGLGAAITNTPNTVVTITNTNQNQNTMTVSFDAVRDKVNNMTSLPDEDIEEIQNRIDEIEEIVNSKETKSKKWSKAKEIIKWIADKGVDVGIALLPLLLKIG